MKREKRSKIGMTGFQEKVNGEFSDNEDVLRKQIATASPATSQFAICAQSSKGMKKQAVGYQENVKSADRNGRFYYILVTAC